MTEDGNIPDIPHIIVTPVNLRAQWEREIKRFLSPASFDILPYIGRVDNRKDWWQAVYGKSLHNECHRIILAATTMSVN